MVGVVLLGLGCGNGGSGDEGDSGIALPGTGEEAPSETTGIPELPGSDDGTSLGEPLGGTELSDDSEGEANAGTGLVDDPVLQLDCGGKTFACGDGMDNDGDGQTDLLDLECTGPCDDDESAFATGIPGDNMDCKQDCFFDGNSGQGDDNCDWNLRCDPENPGENVGCEFRDSGNCDILESTQSATCLDFCISITPPGCDCFGCCLVETEEGERSIFLNSHPDCSLLDLDACLSCTQSNDCVNDCDAEGCERCFAEQELPPECDETEQQCDSGTRCTSTEDCPSNEYCLLGCCLPPPTVG